LAVLNARRGRGQDCRANVAAVVDLARHNRIRLATFWLQFAQGDLLAGEGDPAGAAAHYEALESELATTGLADPDQSCAPELTEQYVQLRRHADATAVAQAFAASAAAKAQPWSLARAKRALALCATGPDAQAYFESALQLHALTADQFETARTELAYGVWLRRQRRRQDARPLLRSALHRFEGLGADPWSDRSVTELQATGETVQRRGTDPADQLTAQERQVAQLLAAGKTTRETAAALFLSPKTVEYHLRHVYSKLGIRSRSALTERLGP